jgi:hypothetical protein
MAFNGLQNSPSGRRAVRKLAALALTTPNTITSFSGAAYTIAATEARTTDLVRVIPPTTLPAALVIANARVTAAGVVTFSIVNPTGADIVLGTSTSFVREITRYDA